mmetsp:Transcript_19756/g.48308  ORF Transcript_19756/g.48308 Transcript_19756/m.48308 type:complete len:313 (+) Transcript_19756:718-1656(+)
MLPSSRRSSGKDIIHPSCFGFASASFFCSSARSRIFLKASKAISFSFEFCPGSVGPSTSESESSSSSSPFSHSLASASLFASSIWTSEGIAGPGLFVFGGRTFSVLEDETSTTSSIVDKAMGFCFGTNLKRWMFGAKRSINFGVCTEACQPPSGPFLNNRASKNNSRLDLISKLLIPDTSSSSPVSMCANIPFNSSFILAAASSSILRSFVAPGRSSRTEGSLTLSLSSESLFSSRDEPFFFDFFFFFFFSFFFILLFTLFLIFADEVPVPFSSSRVSSSSVFGPLSGSKFGLASLDNVPKMKIDLPSGFTA